MNPLTLYGIPNCDSVKKTRQYLDEHEVDYTFVDFNSTPPSAEQLKRWYATYGEALVNKRSKTWRDEKTRATAALLAGEGDIVKLLAEYPKMIKRPVIEEDSRVVLLGWQEARLAALIRDR